MGLVKSFTGRHKAAIIYLALVLGCGGFQLLDWYFGTEDPIWHLFFYLLFYPAFSFFYGLLSGNHTYFWLAPVTAALSVAIVYLFMANGGFRFSVMEMKSALELCVPSFLAALAGTALQRIAMRFL